jgi:hypothetical protein
MLEIDDDCKVRDKDPVHPSGDGYTVITATLDEMVAVMAVGANEWKAVGNVGHSAPAATRQRPADARLICASDRERSSKVEEWRERPQ